MYIIMDIREKGKHLCLSNLFDGGQNGKNYRRIGKRSKEQILDDKDQKILESVIKDFGLFEINPETNDFTADMVTTQLEYRKNSKQDCRVHQKRRQGSGKSG